MTEQPVKPEPQAGARRKAGIAHRIRMTAASSKKGSDDRTVEVTNVLHEPSRAAGVTPNQLPAAQEHLVRTPRTQRGKVKAISGPAGLDRQSKPISAQESPEVRYIQLDAQSGGR